ncbi:MAG: hypothetical protein EP344_17410 [Bacteroidetes bacterium]|nr:MAG: hypothetical protein EP344_17410 [Bacteroidota bacterium]
MKTYLFLTAILLSLPACKQPDTRLTPDQKTAITEAVKTMFDRYFQAIRENGLTAEFDYLDASDDFFWVPPGYTSALTYDSVRTILIDNAGAFHRIDYRWDQVQVHPLSPDLAAYTGIVSGTLQDTTGHTTRLHMTESGVVIRRLDGWKILCGQSAHLPDPDKE